MYVFFIAESPQFNGDDRESNANRESEKWDDG